MFGLTYFAPRIQCSPGITRSGITRSGITRCRICSTITVQRGYDICHLRTALLQYRDPSLKAVPCHITYGDSAAHSVYRFNSNNRQFAESLTPVTAQRRRCYDIMSTRCTIAKDRLAGSLTESCHMITRYTDSAPQPRS